MEKYFYINLEEGMPLCNDAERKLNNEITTAKRIGKKYAVIIHGYGSSGVGGVIRNMVIKTLPILKARHLIKEYVFGEDFNSNCLLIKTYPKLKENNYYNKANLGISIAVIN
jgi:hypothetical protein